MKNRGIRRVVFGAVFLAAAAGLAAAAHYKVVNGPRDFYFGHISYIEPAPGGTDPVVLREGRTTPELAVLNLPVGPGDTIRTSADRRCEIQFDTGTIVRLDFATEVRVETILARSLSRPDELSVLTLGKGRVYVMYKEYDRKELFQFLTPNAAVKMKHNSVAFIAAAADGTSEAQVKYGRAQVLFGSDEKRLDDRTVKKGERLIVQKDNRYELATAIEDTAFELWNKEVNAHFLDLHKGLTPLPEPVQRLTPAVFHFAQTYGNLYGEWLWDDFYGYVWRPYIDNGAYPWGWSPYHYGRWSYSAGQMFWVPQEPWGWIPYHLGIWQWDKKHGWFWLPGSMFAPAWATWDFYFGYACWRPWSLYDWMYDGSYWMSGFGWNAGNLVYDPFWNAGPNSDWPMHRSGARPGASGQTTAALLPVPAELKGLVKKVTAAFESGDARIRAGAAEVPRQLVFVAKGDLNARNLNEKALSLEQVAKLLPPASADVSTSRPVLDPAREAARLFRGIDRPAAAPRKITAPEAKPVEGRGVIAVPASPAIRAEGSARPAAAAAARFRDWNPDLRVARELGVRIEYSSVRNEIICPELRISSRDRNRTTGLVPHMTSDGVRYGPAVSVGGSDADEAGFSQSPDSPSAKGQPERSSSSTKKSGDSKTGEGGKIKK